MSTTDDLTFGDRIEYVKEKIEFFNRPLIYLFPIYPVEDGDEYSSPSNFNIDIIDIESEFGKFQNNFNSVFITEKGKINALKYFDQFFNHQLGYVTVPDERVPGGERYQFDWAKLVFYLIKEYEGSSNYWEYFRNWLDDGNNHIFKGYDEKIEQMALEAHEKLINKFNSFKEEVNQLLFETNTTHQNDQKDDISFFKSGLTEHGFFNLPKIKAIQDPQNIEKLLEYIFIKQLPEKIAMLVYLEFPNYMVGNTKTNDAMFLQLSKLLGTHPRTVKGNIYVLNPKSEEKKTRYTSHLHTETTINFYKNLI